MGGKSIAARAANRRQRQKMNMSRYRSSKIMIRPEDMGIEKDDTIFSPPTRDEVACQNCGFVARYPFIRCPQCNEARK